MKYKIIQVRGAYLVEFDEPKLYDRFFQMDRGALVDRISNLERQGITPSVEYKALAELNAREGEKHG